MRGRLIVRETGAIYMAVPTQSTQSPTAPAPMFGPGGSLSSSPTRHTFRRSSWPTLPLPGSSNTQLTQHQGGGSGTGRTGRTVVGVVGASSARCLLSITHTWLLSVSTPACVACGVPQAGANGCASRLTRLTRLARLACSVIASATACLACHTVCSVTRCQNLQSPCTPC